MTEKLGTHKIECTVEPRLRCIGMLAEHLEQRARQCVTLLLDTN
jgi:hypothetical protein